MNSNGIITRIDLEAENSQAALQAEQRLFAHYELDYQAHFVQMESHDLRLRVLEVGKGKPVMMVPGGCGDAWPMAALMAELQGCRVIAINRPGSGLSDGVDHRRVELRELAVDTIRSVADAFDLEQFPIICNSMGGLWSAWFTLEQPQRVTRMVQMGCPALAADTSAPFFMRLIGIPGINRFVTPLLQPKDVDSALEGLKTQGSYQKDIDRLPVEFAEAAYHLWQLPTYLDNWKTLINAVTTIRGAHQRYSLTLDQLAQITQPVQFLWGANDVFGGLDVAHQIVTRMSDARLHEMDTGHLPFIDQPEESSRVIREFLEEETVEEEPVPTAAV